MTMKQSLAQRVAYGIGAQGLLLVVLTVQQILMVPLFVLKWGTDLYADWLVLFAFATLWSLADAGLRFYFVAEAIKEKAEGNNEGFQRAISTQLGLEVAYAAIGFVALLLCLWLTDIRTLLGVRHMSARAASWTAFLLCSTNLFQIPRSILNTIYRPLGAMSRAVNITTVLYLIQTAAMASGLATGTRPVLLAAIYLITGVGAGYAIQYLDCKRLFPQVGYKLRLPSRKEYWTIQRVSAWYLVPELARMATVSGPVLIISKLAASELVVVVFNTLRTFTGIIRQMTYQFGHASGVEMARQYSEGDRPGMAQLFHWTGRMITSCAAILAGAGFVFGTDVVRIWTAGRVPYSAATMTIFLLGIIAVSPIQPASVLLQYSKLPQPVAISAGLQTIASLVLCSVLVIPLGAPGAALGVVLAEFVPQSLILSRGVSLTGIKVWTYLSEAYGWGVIAALASASVAYIVASLAPIHSLASLAVASSVWGLASAAIAFFIVVKRHHRLWLYNFVRKRCGIG